MKRILIINDHHSAQGGADRIAIEFYESYKSKGYEVKLLTYKDIESTYYGNTWNNILKNLFNFKVYKKLRYELTSFNPDIIIVHSWTKKLSPSCFLACKGYNIRIVAHDYFLMCPNGGQYNYQTKRSCQYAGGSLMCGLTNCDKRNYVQKLYRFLRFWVQTWCIKLVKPQVICLNQIQQQLLGKSASKSALMPNNINYMNGGFINKVGDNILFIGRPDPEKGLDRMVNVTKNTDFKIDLVGVNQSDIGEKINSNLNCYGWIDAGKVALRLENARLLIFPSRWFEVDPLVPLEACSRGVPVFCSSDNVFAATLKRYQLSDFIFSSDNELRANLERAYLNSGEQSTKQKFYDLFLNERLHREKLDVTELID